MYYRSPTESKVGPYCCICTGGGDEIDKKSCVCMGNGETKKKSRNKTTKTTGMRIETLIRCGGYVYHGM